MPVVTLVRSLLVALIAAAAVSQCPTFGPFVPMGTLPTNVPPAGTLSEVSGLVCSRRQPGVLWAHDDSGHGPIFVGVRGNGAVVQHWSIAGVSSIDWEDMSLGPGPQVGRDYLYFADMGNNTFPRTVFALHRVPEPEPPAAPGAVITLTNAESFPFQSPGAAANAEALFVDPGDGTPWIVTKSSSQAVLYRYPLPLQANVTRTLVQEAVLTLPSFTVTGADVTSDGSRIFVRTSTQLLLFARARGASVVTAMTSPACVLFTGNQGQVESVAIEPDGAGLWTVAEGAGAPLLRAAATSPATCPAWWSYGSTVGSGAMPGVGPDAAPVLGTTTNLGVFDARALAVVVCALSIVRFPDGAHPFGNGFLLLDPEALFATTLSPAGDAVIGLPPVPPDPALAALLVYAQAFVVDTTATNGIAVSRGLALRLGG